MEPHTRRTGGLALLVSAVVLAAAVMLELDRPAALAPYAEAGPTWILSAWFMAMAGLLWIAGATILARSFRGTVSEAWATLAQAGALFAGVALIGVGGIQSFGFRGLATGTVFNHTEEAFTALAYASFALGMMGTAAYHVAIACFGVAMLRSDAWPPWLALSAVVIGAVTVAIQGVETTLTPVNQTVAMVLYSAGLIWVGVTGWALLGMGRGVAARKLGAAATG